ncbi:MAG TPA: hypothetical protein VH601_08085 [Bryobacteraceae bacterium]|jgi:hypothetical protein
MLKRVAGLLLMTLMSLQVQEHPFSAKIENWLHLAWKRAERLCTPSVDELEMKIAVDPDGTRANLRFVLQVSTGFPFRHTHKITLSFPLYCRSQNKNFIPSSMTRAS